MSHRRLATVCPAVGSLFQCPPFHLVCCCRPTFVSSVMAAIGQAVCRRRFAWEGGLLAAEAQGGRRVDK